MRSPLLVLATAIAIGPSTAAARDYILTIGGGYSPSGNQVSLEKNVLFFGRVIESSLAEGYEHTIFFADGDDSRRDVQFIDSESPAPRIYALLARLFDETDHLFERYRDHAVENVAGSASVANVRNWFETVGRSLTADDRLILYVTAHGGRSNDRERPRNTILHLWNDEDVTVEEFAAELDKVSPEVPVVLVMVQCYSGGFADLLFDDADPGAGVAQHNRCGFFATTHKRVAAGCTPDIEDADYREYSSAFWAAILGETRTGEAVEMPDYDKDGQVSFAEAHAYVLIHSDTIDIPVTMSDAFLRAYSSEPERDANLAVREAERRRPPAEEDRERPSQQKSPQTVTALRPVEPLRSDSPIESLLAAAEPPARAAIDGLSERLSLKRSDRAAETRELAEKVEGERRRLRGRIGRLSRSESRARSEIETDVLDQWPELAGIWNAEGRRVVAEESHEVLGMIESHPRFKDWRRLESERIELEEQRDDLERDWVKCQRLLGLLETTALGHNLPLTADVELLSRYEQLRAAENASFRTKPR